MVTGTAVGLPTARERRGNGAAQPSRLPARARTYVLLMPVGAASAAAGFAFHGVFGYPPLVRPVCVAAGAPLLLAAAPSLARRNLPVPISIAVSVCVLPALACVLLFPAAHGFPVTGSRLTVIGDGLVSGWARLLNITLPVPARPGLTVVPFALTWLASSVGAELVLRTRSVLAPLATALLVLAVGTALSVPDGGPGLPEGGAFAAAALTLALLRNLQAIGIGRVACRPGTRWNQATARPVRQSPSGRQRPLRQLALSGLPAVLAVTTAALLAGPRTIPGRIPVDPRHYWPAPVQSISAANPLDEVAAWLAKPNLILFQVRAPAAAADWQLGVLDRFDGQRWTSSARFTPAGRGVPEPARLPRGDLVQERFQIERLGGFLLPVAYRPIALAATGLSVDPDTGMLLTARPLHAGVTYSVTSELDLGIGPRQLAGLTAAPQPATSSDLTVPVGAPAALYTLARKAARTGAPGRVFQQAASLERYLQKAFINDPKDPAGSAYGDLARFLATREGTSVQFAATFTLAARLLGIPSRLVVGFVAATAGSGGMLRRVRSGNALVWSELDFAGAGWIPFFPTPSPTSSAKPRAWAAPEGETPAQARIRLQALKLKPERFTSVTRPRPPSASTRRPEHQFQRLAAAGAAAALLCYLITVLLVAPLHRRRRRHAGPPRARIIRAWHELLAQLTAMGMPASPGAANSTIAQTAISAVGQDVAAELNSLAVMVNRAMYAQSEATDQQAARAWRYRAATRIALRTATPLSRRLRARLTVRLVRRGSTSSSSSGRG